MKIFIILLLFSGVANAGVYKCKNAEGEISYQQSPCAGDGAVKDYKFHAMTQETRDELARLKKEGYADKLRDKYKKLQVAIAIDRGSQAVNDRDLTIGRKAMHEYYNKTTKRYIAEMELIKLEAKDKGIKLY